MRVGAVVPWAPDFCETLSPVRCCHLPRISDSAPDEGPTSLHHVPMFPLFSFLFSLLSSGPTPTHPTVPKVQGNLPHHHSKRRFGDGGWLTTPIHRRRYLNTAVGRYLIGTRISAGSPGPHTVSRLHRTSFSLASSQQPGRSAIQICCIAMERAAKVARSGGSWTPRHTEETVRAIAPNDQHEDDHGSNAGPDDNFMISDDDEMFHWTQLYAWPHQDILPGLDSLGNHLNSTHLAGLHSDSICPVSANQGRKRSKYNKVKSLLSPAIFASLDSR